MALPCVSGCWMPTKLTVWESTPSKTYRTSTCCHCTTTNCKQSAKDCSPLCVPSRLCKYNVVLRTFSETQVSFSWQKMNLQLFRLSEHPHDLGVKTTMPQNVIFYAKTPNIIWFELLLCGNLLLFSQFFFIVNWKSITRCWLDKSGHLTQFCTENCWLTFSYFFLQCLD